MIAFFPESAPSLGPRIVQIVSVIGEVMYTFITSPHFTARAFKEASIKTSLTLSQDTTLASSKAEVVSAICPPQQGGLYDRNLPFSRRKQCGNK